MKIRFLGHSAIIASINKVEVGIDPWLKGNPSCPEGLVDSRIDLIVLTHGHADHAGDALRIAKLHNSTIAATYELACILKDEGVEPSKLIYMNTGGSSELLGVTVSLTPALHSSSFDTASKGTLYAGQPCGVVVKAGGKTIFHAGDTALFSDLKVIGEKHKPDVAFLPVGDQFTMGVDDAVIAAKWLGAKIVVPIHHSTFSVLHGDPRDFKAKCEKQGITAKVLSPGDFMEI